MHTIRLLLVFASFSLVFSACGDDDSGRDPGTSDDAGMADGGVTTADGGDMADAGPSTPTPEAFCDAATRVEASLGEQQITGDTTGASPVLTLDGCGDSPAPQQVFAIVLPGEGSLGVRFSLANDGTSAELDTVVQLREDCVSPEAPVCFDDVTLGELRSGGSFGAEGGDTVYLVVSGFDETQAGPFTMDLTVEENAAPTLDEAATRRLGNRMEVTVTGGDADANATAVQVQFLEEEGDTALPIDVDGDGTPDTDVIGAALETEDTSDFTETVVLEPFDLLRGAEDAVRVRVTLVDAFQAASEPVTVDIATFEEVGLADECDEVKVCARGLSCEEGTCALGVDAAAVCEERDVETLAVPDGGEPSQLETTVTIEPGDGALFASCGRTGGTEEALTFVVPELDGKVADLVVSTVNEATGSADTVVYLQATCGDEPSEVACNDDAAERVFQSTAVVEEVEAGAFTALVELYAGAAEATDVQLDVRLRPVLPADAACDPEGVANRCLNGPCPEGEDSVCP